MYLVVLYRRSSTSKTYSEPCQTAKVDISRKYLMVLTVNCFRKMYLDV